MKILLDPGHGIETPGKRSPYGFFPEFEYNHIIAYRVIANLLGCGYDTQLFIPELEGISLSEHYLKVNA